jgi:biotin transport system substrate-specific component
MSTTGRLSLSKRLDLTEPTLAMQTLWIALFAGATMLGARIEIAHVPVPYTLQTMMVLLAGAFLGARNGAISQVCYIASGILGAPVFAGGAWGPMALIGPTGGYLLAFPVAAALVGFMVDQRRSLAWTFLAMAAGLVVIFASGTIYLYAFTLRNWDAAVKAGFLLFTWWDLMKLSAAAMIYHEVAKRWRRLPAM